MTSRDRLNFERRVVTKRTFERIIMDLFVRVYVLTGNSRTTNYHDTGYGQCYPKIKPTLFTSQVDSMFDRFDAVPSSHG